MRQLTPKLWLGNIGEFGDIGVLQAAGVELAFLTHGGKGFSHSVIPSCAFSIQADGSSPDWYIKGIALLLAEAYQSRVLSVHDDSGGNSMGAFLIAGAAAQKLARKYSTTEGELKTLIGVDWVVPVELSAQGRRIWP